MCSAIESQLFMVRTAVYQSHFWKPWSVISCLVQKKENFPVKFILQAEIPESMTAEIKKYLSFGYTTKYFFQSTRIT